jgi:hypothetical protein
MKGEISKTNESLAFFNSRLDEVRMSGTERLKAKARLAQAEAFADAVAALIGLIKRPFKGTGVRPYRGPTASAG